MAQEMASSGRKLDGLRALEAIKEFMEWGAKTGSDRDYFESKFREILQEAGVEFSEPEY